MGVIIKDQKWFEEKIKDYHGDNVTVVGEYIGMEKPISIIYHCKEHGDTTTTINAKNICKDYFLPCKQCQSKRKSKSAKGTLKGNDRKEFYYKRLQDYCKQRGGVLLSTEWTRAKDTYEFKCENHEHPPFYSTADALYSGEHWCPYCCGRKGNFEDDIKQIIESKNGELLSSYISSGEYVKVRCKKHNHEWDILPNNIKKGRWCPICKMHFNEKVVWDYFKNNMINVIPQYTFNDLLGKNNEKLKFDFAILSTCNTLMYLVEVDDEEHRDNHDNCKKRQIARLRDKEKDKYCIERNIKLYRMDVPFRNNKKWKYDDYYRYINTELKFIVNSVRLEDNKWL